MSEAQTAENISKPASQPATPRCAELVAKIGNLDPHPLVCAQAVEKLNAHNASAGALAQFIANDPALAARVMRHANSFSLGKPRQITSLDQALMRLGMRPLRGILTEACIRNTARNVSPIEQLIWENSIITAIGCRETALYLKRPQIAEEMYMLGLLHDIGKLVLLDQVPQFYSQVAALCTKGVTFVDAEKKVLTFAHQLAGSMLAQRWNFPEQHCQIILSHHQTIAAAPRTPVEARRTVLQFADLAAHHLGFGHENGYPAVGKELNQLAKFLGFKRPGIDTILRRMESATTMLPVFR